MMTFNEAVRVLKGPRENTVAGYVNYSTAAATYYAHLMRRTDHPEPPRSVLTMDDAGCAASRRLV